MTGRELIMYILENHLEDELVIDNNRVGKELLGFMTPMRAAVKFDVGLSTINVWCELGMLQCFKIGDLVFIPANADDPREGAGNA